VRAAAGRVTALLGGADRSDDGGTA
jgi:hypothetical protein